MITFSWIKGISVGLQYVESEEMGFVVNLDLGIVAITWYRDLEEITDESE